MGPSILKDDRLISMIQADVLRLAVERKFNSLEKPKQFCLLLEPFSVENEILTPTMKLKRNVAKQIYKAEIERMYTAGPWK
jgi:long-chain acyl-CoA synthetase